MLIFQSPKLLDLIQDIEPLDISLIQKDVPPTTIDAMKRTISGMLGLLPSNQFQILVEALWEPLSRLLVSSMMTGYTLRNAEYRLCLEKNLDIHDENNESQISEALNLGLQELLLDSVRRVQVADESVVSSSGEEIAENPSEDLSSEDIGEITPEIQSYIRHLRSRLSATKKELREVKRKNAALQMQQFVGEEKNELLDYLRSLQPEKVAELSEPTSAEVKETIHSVVHGLLATLSPKMHSKAPPLSEKNAAGALNVENEDCAELIENTSLNFQPIISLTRDYLARLIFWCMLLGHYVRGLEYRTQLTELLSLSPNNEDNSLDRE
uniref:MAR-binding filament-like protein 1 n=1 Tax=Chenopodium quinoa TaxID=63459 RepID=A0A803LPK7_CHEQI